MNIKQNRLSELKQEWQIQHEKKRNEEGVIDWIRTATGGWTSLGGVRVSPEEVLDWVLSSELWSHAKEEEMKLITETCLKVSKVHEWKKNLERGFKREEWSSEKIVEYWRETLEIKLGGMQRDPVFWRWIRMLDKEGVQEINQGYKKLKKSVLKRQIQNQGWQRGWQAYQEIKKEWIEQGMDVRDALISTLDEGEIEGLWRSATVEEKAREWSDMEHEIIHGLDRRNLNWRMEKWWLGSRKGWREEDRKKCWEVMERIQIQLNKTQDWNELKRIEAFSEWIESEGPVEDRNEWSHAWIQGWLGEHLTSTLDDELQKKHRGENALIMEDRELWDKIQKNWIESEGWKYKMNWLTIAINLGGEGLKWWCEEEGRERRLIRDPEGWVKVGQKVQIREYGLTLQSEKKEALKRGWWGWKNWLDMQYEGLKKEGSIVEDWDAWIRIKKMEYSTDHGGSPSVSGYGSWSTLIRLMVGERQRQDRGIKRPIRQWGEKEDWIQSIILGTIVKEETLNTGLEWIEEARNQEGESRLKSELWVDLAKEILNVLETEVAKDEDNDWGGSEKWKGWAEKVILEKVLQEQDKIDFESLRIKSCERGKRL